MASLTISCRDFLGLWRCGALRFGGVQYDHPFDGWTMNAFGHSFLLGFQRNVVISLNTRLGLSGNDGTATIFLPCEIHDLMHVHTMYVIHNINRVKL